MNVTLLNDILFKIVFGTEIHSEALRGLLNAILHLEGARRITEITILNPTREKVYLEDKETVLDIKAKDGHGVLYNIEIQLQSQIAYRQRSLYYAATLVSQQLLPSQDYRLLKKVIHISLTDFVLFADQSALHSTYVLYDPKHQRSLGDDFELHYLEMPKFSKTQPEELEDPLERWLYFLRHATDYQGVSELPEPLLHEEGIKTAMKATHNAMSDEEVRYAIEARQKYQRDRVTELNVAVEEGEARGEARGELLGRARAARALRDEGIAEEVVFRTTGLRFADL